MKVEMGEIFIVWGDGVVRLSRDGGHPVWLRCGTRPPISLPHTSEGFQIVHPRIGKEEVPRPD